MSYEFRIMNFILIPAFVFHGIVCSRMCGTLHRSVRYSASPPFLLSKREEAVLYIFNQLHNYHISFSSLLTIFEDSDRIQGFRKARVVPGWPPLLEEVRRRPYHINFISLFNIFEVSTLISISEKRGLCVVPLLRRG